MRTFFHKNDMHFQLTVVVSAEPTDYHICGAVRRMAIPQSRCLRDSSPLHKGAFGVRIATPLIKRLAMTVPSDERFSITIER